MKPPRNVWRDYSITGARVGKRDVRNLRETIVENNDVSQRSLDRYLQLLTTRFMGPSGR